MSQAAAWVPARWRRPRRRHRETRSRDERPSRVRTPSRRVTSRGRACRMQPLLHTGAARAGGAWLTDGAPATAGDPRHGPHRPDRRGLAAGRRCQRERERRRASGGAACSAAVRRIGGRSGRARHRGGRTPPSAACTLGRRRDRRTADAAHARASRAPGLRLTGGRPGDRGWDVAALQFLLAWRGFPSGTIDGGFGAHTEAALIRYQRWAGPIRRRTRRAGHAAVAAAGRAAGCR